MKAKHKIGTFIKFSEDATAGSPAVEKSGIITGVISRRDGFHYEVGDEVVDEKNITASFREILPAKPRAKRTQAPAPKGTNQAPKTSATKAA